MFVFVSVFVCIDVMYEMLCTTNKCINIEYIAGERLPFTLGNCNTGKRFQLYWLCNTQKSTSSLAF